MKQGKLLWFLFWSLLLLSMVQAGEINQYVAEYNLVLDKAIVDININFDNFHSQVEWTLPRDASAIEVSEGLNFVVEESENTQKIIVKGKLFNQLHLKYITGSVIEKTQDRFFILDLGKITADSFLVTVKLPDQATLKYSLDDSQSSIIPKPGSIRTDGKRIIIQWNDKDIEKSRSFLVIYSVPSTLNPLFIYLTVILIVFGSAIIAGVYYFYHFKNKKRKAISKKIKPRKAALTTPSNLTRNLFEDEKKVVEILMAAKDHELWQKELALKSGLSKVKLSRKLRSLEQKGLIEKIPYGNTNKIRVREE